MERRPAMDHDASKLTQSASPDFYDALDEFIGDEGVEVAAVKLGRSVTCVRYWRMRRTCPHPNDADQLAAKMGKSAKALRGLIKATREKRKAVAP